MAKLEIDPRLNILAKDPGHVVWIDGISQSCGLDRPSLQQANGVAMDAWTRIWTFIWLVGPDSGLAKSNYGVRITQQGNKYKVLVRGVNCHASLEYLDWFPAPDQIITLAMLAGFDWA